MTFGLTSIMDSLIGVIAGFIVAIRDLILAKLSPYGELVLIAAAVGIAYLFTKWKQSLTVLIVVLASIVYLIIKLAGGAL